MVCPHCGAHIEPRAAVRFCGKCGKPISEEQEKISRAQGRAETVRQCGAGHFFSAAVDSCPYCQPAAPPKAAPPAGESTSARREQRAVVLDRTEIVQALDTARRGLTSPLRPTVSSAPPPVIAPAASHAAPPSDAELRSTGVSKLAPAGESAEGRLIGWMVSYDLDPNGKDIRLQDGHRYRVGAHTQCQIVVDHSSVSQHHATLIAQDGKVFVKDELSTNGTRVNDSPIIGAVELSSYDDVKFGDVTYAFISARCE